MNKKDLKHEVYNKAHEVLTSKSVADINELKDPGVDTVKYVHKLKYIVKYLS
jgi:hypothetical protein